MSLPRSSSLPADLNKQHKNHHKPNTRKTLEANLDSLRETGYKLKVYIAGPDVFLPNAVEYGKTLVAIAERHGYVGLSPLDNEIDAKPGCTPYELGIAIFRANLEIMQKADFIVANMTPFRGPGMDQGTAFEMAYMLAQGKPVLAYTTDPRLYLQRVEDYYAQFGQPLKADKDDPQTLRDPDGNDVEALNMIDNLMPECAVNASQSKISDSFEHALEENKELLQRYAHTITERAATEKQAANIHRLWYRGTQAALTVEDKNALEMTSPSHFPQS